MVQATVAEARRIVSYLTQLSEEMRPPVEIWHSPTKCQHWIDDHMPGNKNPSRTGMLEFDDREIERAV